MPSTLSWPEWMPAPQQDSFSIQPEDRRLTSETEAGAIIRKQFDSDVNVADCTVVLDTAEAAWLEKFERDVSRQGTVWFSFPLWIGGQLVHEQCRFKTRPKMSGVNGLTSTYSFSLYVSKRSDLLSDDAYATLTEIGADQIERFSNLLHIILHVESPGLTRIPALRRA